MASRQPVAERLVRRTERTDTGCWIWTGCRTPGGYGVITVNRGARRAHRVAYEVFVGPIPDGLVIDHLCRVRACINPAHLEAVTQQRNVIRAYAANLPQDRCCNGHVRTAENTVRRARGDIRCSDCSRQYTRDYRERRREKVIA